MTPPAAAAAAAARTVQPRRTAVPARRLTPPRRPRRVSGPARGLRERPAGVAEGRRPLAVAVPAALGSLAGHRLLDRLIAGKAWIVLVAFALIGIVTLQLAMLQLNTSIGRSLERAGSLQRENAALSIENSEMAAGDRVESRAAQLGMELVPAGALRFLTARPRTDPARAAGALSTTVQPSSSGVGESASGATASGASAEAAAPSGSAAEQGPSASPSSSAGEAGGAPAGQASAGSGEPASSASPAPGAAPAPAGGASTEAAPAPAGGASTEASPAGGTQPGPAG